MATTENPNPNAVVLESPIASVSPVKIDPKPVEIEPAFNDPSEKKPETVEDLIAQSAQPTSSEVEKEDPSTVTEEALKPTKEAIEAETEQEAVPADNADKLKDRETKKTETPASDGTDDVLESIHAKSQPDYRGTSEPDEELDLVVNQVILGKKSDLQDDIRKFYKTDEEVKAASTDEKSLFSAATSALLNGWNTGSNNSYMDVLAENSKMGDRLVQQSRCGVERIPDGMPKRINHKSVHITNPKEARLVLRARLGGLYRANLLNSGFWVAMRAPTIAELHEIFTTIDLEGREIGRTIGTHFALISDMYLKRKFVEMLIQYKIIIETNFVDINKSGAFVRNLSFHDYDTLVHGIVTLMSRKGLRIRMVCPKCGEISTEENMDISACKFVNMDLLKTTRPDDNTPSVCEWWSITRNKRGEAVQYTENDLERYRTKVLNLKRTIRQNIEIGDDKVAIELDLAVPTMQRYFQVGEKLIDQINATINGIANGDSDKTELVKASLAIHGYQLTAPWIKELRIYKEDGKTVESIIDDPDIIVEYLDQTIQQDTDNDLFEELNQFIADSRFNYIGSFSLECPKCHAKPESKLDNFFPLEIQTIFFGLLFRVLRSVR